MSFTQYTPHVLTGASLFLAIFLHWKTPNDYWKPSMVSASVTAVLAVMLIFALQGNYLQLDESPTSISGWSTAVAGVAGLGFFYGLIIAALIGYIIKLAPTFFD